MFNQSIIGSIMKVFWSLGHKLHLGETIYCVSQPCNAGIWGQLDSFCPHILVICNEWIFLFIIILATVITIFSLVAMKQMRFNLSL